MRLKKNSMKTIFYITLYGIVLALSFSIALTFAPFEYVDNDHSYISCFNDGKKYEASPNYIFALDTKLDSFNDIKARKLCEHKIISDYINSYSTPAIVNYQFLPAVTEDSSWLNVAFVFLLTFFSGSLLVERFGRLFKFKYSSFGQSLLNIFSEITG